MTEIVGADSPFTRNQRKGIAAKNPYERNDFLMRMTNGDNAERTTLTQNLMKDGTYRSGDVLWQYPQNDNASVPVIRYTRDNETGLQEPYNVNITASTPGFDPELLKTMGDTWKATEATVAKNVFGDNSEEKKAVYKAIQSEWMYVSTLYDDENHKGGVREEFFKIGMKLYENHRKGRLDDPTYKAFTFQGSDVTDAIIRSQYYYGSPPGNEYVKIIIPKKDLSPFGQYDNDIIFDALRYLRHSDLSPYINSKILGTMIGDEGANTMVYFNTDAQNRGIAIFTTETNIQGVESKQHGVIPFDVFGKYVVYRHRLSMLEELSSWFGSNLNYEGLLNEVSNFEKALGPKSTHKPVLQRSLAEIRYTDQGTISPGSLLHGAWLLRSVDPVARGLYKLREMNPALEFNQSVNWLRNIFYSETEIGMNDRDLIIEVMNNITPKSSQEEIMNVIFTMQMKEVSVIRDHWDEIGLIAGEMGTAIKEQFLEAYNNFEAERARYHRNKNK